MRNALPEPDDAGVIGFHKVALEFIREVRSNAKNFSGRGAAIHITPPRNSLFAVAQR
jgi:hypothetical protein